MKIKKKIITLLLFLNVVMICFSSSYALFQVSVIKNSVIKLYAGDINVSLTSQELTSNKTLTLSGYDNKEINLTLTNTSDKEAFIKLYYIAQTTDIIFASDTTFLNANKEIIGEIEENSNETITLVVINNTANTINIDFGLMSGLVGYDLDLSTDKNQISLTDLQLFSDYLKQYSSTGLDLNTSYDGMYRYIGTSVNNYIKLDGILYRIIGLTSTQNTDLNLSENQIKVIKSTNPGTHTWHDDYASNQIWTGNSMYNYLQNNVLNDTSVISEKWKNKISSVKWYIGDCETALNASSISANEKKLITSTNSKLGLMSLSDYYYAEIAGGTTNCTSVNCTNWLNVNSYEWFINRSGYFSSGGYYTAWYTRDDGKVSANILYSTFNFRPVFYLNNDLKYLKGSGVESDPFIVI